MQEDGIKYEKYCCEYLQNQGYSTKTTVASGDQGIDIIAEKDDVKYAIQCKFRTEGSIGNDAIQQAHAGKDYYDCDLAMVITNVDFTPKAISLAKKLKVKLRPGVRMTTNDHYSYEENNIEVEKEDEHTYKAIAGLSPFIFGVSTVLSDLEERIEYGESIINQRFGISYTAPLFNNDEENDFPSLFNSSIKSNEEEYLKGKAMALNLLQAINEFSDVKFSIVDWSYSSDRDKNIYVYETTSVINISFSLGLQKKLSRLFDVEVTVIKSTINSIVVSLINHNNHDVSDILKYISNFIIKNTSRNIIGIDLEGSLINYYRIYKYKFNDKNEDSDNYEFLYLFSCKDVVDDNIYPLLERNIREFTKRRLILQKKDSHTFVIGIKKLIGLNDYLSVVDTIIFRGQNLSHLLSISVGKCEGSIVFTVKLKKIDISRYDDLITDSKRKATINAYLEQIRYYIIGLFDLTMIDQVKEKKLDIPLCIKEDSFWVEGIKIEGIIIKVVDMNNRVIIWEDACINPINGLSLFPLKGFSHDNFTTNREPKNAPNSGLNAMMIQKMLQDAPQLEKQFRNHYIINTLIKKLDKYISIIDNYFSVISNACRKLESAITQDNSVFCDTTTIQHFYYNIPTSEIYSFYRDECDEYPFWHENFFFWKIASSIVCRELVWGKPQISEQDDPQAELITFINKFLDNKGVEYAFLNTKNSNTVSLHYQIQGDLEPDTIQYEINELIQHEDEEISDERLHIYKRTHGDYIFVLDSCGAYIYDHYCRPIQSLKNTKRTKPLSFWMIDQSLNSFCEFQSFYGTEDEVSSIALLTIRLKNLSIEKLESHINGGSENNSQLWGVWNDFLYSLLSILNFCEGVYSSTEIFCLDAEIEVYDSNYIKIADLFNSSIKYSYFLFYKPDILGFHFHSWYSRFNKGHDEYKREIIPILNNTLQNAIESLEQLSKD